MHELRSVAKRIWHIWTDIGSAIGDFQSRFWLNLFYFTMALPFALVARILDPLRLRQAAVRSAWVKRSDDRVDLGTARRQF